MELTGEDRRLLHEALCDAFPSVSVLRQMVLFRCDQRLDVFTDGPLGTRVFELIAHADSQGWVDKLIEGAHSDNRGNKRLATFYGRFVAAPHRHPSTSALERIVKQSKVLHDIVVIREAIEHAEYQICRVLTSAGAGTGFLVARNVVLTCHHVIDGVAPEEISLEFDYKVRSPGQPVPPGRKYGVKSVLESKPPSDADSFASPKPQEASPDELDYAFLCVDGTPGDEVIEGRPRGWAKIVEPGHVILPKSDLVIIQHPKGGPMKVASDEVLKVNKNQTRVTYTTNTEGGSSGSPCFDADWHVVALHHSGDPRLETPAKYNEGVPLATIRAHMRDATKQAIGWT
jgi:Trypsin-like peptidase domain/Effector-associated domain 1